MEPITWSTAIAIIGSVGTVVLGLMKIVAMRKESPKKEDTSVVDIIKQLEDHNARCDNIKSEVSVLQAQIAELQKDTDRQEEAISKLHDLLFKLLTDK